MKEYILVSGFLQGLLEKHKNFSKNWKEIGCESGHCLFFLLLYDKLTLNSYP